MIDKAVSVLAKLKNKAKISGISYQQCVTLDLTTKVCYTYFSNMEQGEFKICRFQVDLPSQFIYLPV